MGRIPLLLPLDVKCAEAGQRNDQASRLRLLANGNARRFSYASSDASVLSSATIGRESPASDAATPSAVFNGLDRGTRPEGGLLASKDTTSAAASCNHSSSSSASTCSSSFLINSNDSIDNGRTSSHRPAAPPSSASSHDGVALGVSSSPIPGNAMVAFISRNRQSPAAAAAAAAAGPHDASGSRRAPGLQLSGMALAQIALSTCCNAEQQLRELSDRSPGAPPSPSGAAAAAAAGPQSSFPPQRRPMPPALPPGSLALPPTPPYRHASSAANSPITSPIGHYGGGRLLGALLDHRQTLSYSHPSGPRVSLDRPTQQQPQELAAEAEAEQQQQEQPEQQAAADWRASASTWTRAGGGGGSAGPGGSGSGSPVSEAASQAEAQQPQPSGPSKTVKSGVLWALPNNGRCASDGCVQPLSQSGPCITAAAMRALVELQGMDEYSLVAAARQRQQQQQLAQRSLSKQTTPKKGGGAGARSIRTSFGDQLVSPLAQTALPLLLAARTSCPELGDFDPALALAALSNAIHSGVASPVRTPPAAAAEAAATAGYQHPGGDASGTATFLPSVLSPRSKPMRHSFTNRSTASSGGPPARHAMSDFGAGQLADGGLMATAAAGAAVEPEAALAAVRALAARFGTMAPEVTPSEPDEHDTVNRDRRKKLLEALQAANPAAYHEEAAEAAEAAYRSLSERAKYRLRRLFEEATTQEAPLRQLEEAVRELTSQRPFFLPPVIPKPKMERSYVESDHKGAKAVAWDMDESLFAQRKKDTESHDLYDTDKVRNQQLNLDWKRVVSKTRFRRMVARGDSGVKEDGQSLEEELGEVREELERQGNFIRSAFLYYGMTSGAASATSSDVLQMSASAWLSFCHDAGIVGKAGTGMDMQNIFVAVNFEEESATEEAEANDDDAMVRFEFMEGLVRAAFSKFITTKRMRDASDALGALLAEITSSPNLPPEARVDPNEFRRTRFYCHDVEEVVKEYYDLLVGMFKLYKARDRSRYFWPEHFTAFLESNQLLGPATGLTRREAKLMYGWSQALVTDELRRRQRAVSLTLWDFIEVVARLADFISPPDQEEITQFFLEAEEEPPELDRLVYDYYRALGDAGALLRRRSAGLMSPPTRPLATKLRLLLQYLTSSLKAAWGGLDAKEVAAKVLRTATYLSGGIEMG